MKKLTLAEIRKTVDHIATLAEDPEVAHGAEDTLYEEILEAIANGTCEKPKEAAALALTTKAMSFARWYA